MEKKMNKKITIKNGDEINEGIFIISDKSYTFPFTSSSYKREKEYVRGNKSYNSIGMIELDLCFGSYDTEKALKGLEIESDFEPRTSYADDITEYRSNIGKLVRGNITPTKDKINAYCFNEVRKQIPRGLVDLIEQTNFEFVVEPIVRLGDETFNRTYAIYGHKLVIRSPDLFNAEVKIE